MQELPGYQKEISEKETQITEKRKALGARMSSNYKAGPAGALEMILSSASFEELTSNIYYLDKISESDQKMIEEVKNLKAALESDKAALQSEKTELENKKTELENLRTSQESQLNEISARQADAANVVSNLDDNVKELIAQRDSELLAAQQEAERVAAQRAAASSNSGGGSSYSGGGGGGGGGTSSAGSGSAAAVVNAAGYTGSTGAGFCAAWVSNVFSNAGVGTFYGNACDMYYSWCYSTDQSAIEPGMIIAVPTLGGSAAALIYGHVGIYIGGGMVRHCLSGVVRSQSLSSWISQLGALSTPRWGWLGGVVLS